MERVRLACVRYLNTLPLVHGLEKLPQIELLPTVPSHIAGMVRDGRADVGLVSLVEAAQVPESGVRLTLLPSGMIGCDGDTLTVRLFSSVPLERATRVHADADSRTSVALCRVLLDSLYGVRPAIVEFDARERIAVGGGAPENSPDGWPETVLLIGDKVVTDPPPADRFPHQLDLGRAWKDLTGLPFVYAVWACREGEAESPSIRLAAALLDRQRRRNAGRVGWIADRFAAEHRWPPGLAARYLESLLRFHIGPREREGVDRFLRMAADLGATPRDSVSWADAPVGAGA